MTNHHPAYWQIYGAALARMCLDYEHDAWVRTDNKTMEGFINQAKHMADLFEKTIGWKDD